jgi:diadenosine tetraphosphate (Ap4A) HIT family hydrolase
MEKFILHPSFINKLFIYDLALCRVLLNDIKECPWIFLIPRRINSSHIHHLSPEDQTSLIKEISFASHIMEQAFPCDRLNIGSIGNITPQLHIHIIARKKSDPYWPDVVWNKPLTHLTKEAYEERAHELKQFFLP